MTTKARILVTPASLCRDPRQLSGLSRVAEVFFSSQSLPDKLDSFDVVILGNEAFTANEIRMAKALKLIFRYGVTVHNVDLNAARAARVKVANCPGLSADSVAEYIVAGIVDLVKRLRCVSGRTSAELSDFVFEDIAGKTVGIIGLGNVGMSLAKKCRALDMNVIATSRTPKDEFCLSAGAKFSTLENLLASSDIVSLNMTLTNSTKQFMDAPKLAQLKDGAILINTAQAEVLDAVETLRLLRAGRLSGFISDFKYESVSFSGLPNVIITPHISGRSWRTTHNKVRFIVQEVTKFLDSGSLEAPQS